MRHVLSQSFPPYIPATPTHILPSAYRVDDAVFNAIYAGDVQRIQTLCDDHEIDLTIMDLYANTPLHLAIRLEQQDITDILLRQIGPNNVAVLITEDNNGYTPLMLATKQRNAHSMKCLVDIGQYHPTYNQIPLQNEKHLETFSSAIILLEAQGDISKAFHLAIDYRVPEAAQLYFYAGANTSTALRSGIHTIQWLADQGLIHANDALTVLDEAVQANDTKTIAALTQPLVMLHALDNLAAPSDRTISDILNAFFRNGARAEKLLAALIDRLASSHWTEAHRSEARNFDVLRLLLGMKTPCEAQMVKLVRNGGFTNLWIVTCMASYGADATAALRELRVVSEHWGNSIARCALEHILHNVSLTNNEKIVALRNIIVEDQQNEAINVAVRTLVNDGPLEHVSLLISAGLPYDDMLLVELSSRAKPREDHAINIRAHLSPEQALTQHYIRHQINCGADFFSTKKILPITPETSSLKNGDIVEIQKCRITANIIMNATLQALLQDAGLSSAKKIAILHEWMKDERIKVGLSDLLFDIIEVGHLATAKLMILADVPATAAFIKISKHLLNHNPAAKTHTAHLTRLGADYQPALQQLLASAKTYANSGNHIAAEQEQNALNILSTYIAAELRYL